MANGRFVGGCEGVVVVDLIYICFCGSSARYKIRGCSIKRHIDSYLGKNEANKHDVDVVG
jgi:hypothetical protein